MNDVARAAEVPWPPAWWLWVLGQAAVLAAYAGGFKFAGGYPEPVAATADLGVALAQVVLASLLGPALLGSPRRLTCTLAAGALFGGLASLLAATPFGDTLRLSIVALAWIIGFATAGRRAGRVLAFLTVAGPVLWYVSQEYGSRRIDLGDWPTLLVPTLGLVTTRLHSDVIPGLLAAVALGVMGGLPRWRSVKLRKKHTKVSTAATERADDKLSTIATPAYHLDRHPVGNRELKIRSNSPEK